ncbi:hypothetical protein [Candidatus Nitrospira allomarina]|uniref:DUF5666 domain-containing protein n=1 Tax=Candidatus Nitrospira allomarina TaxID=3020900 RepID=A0AA96GCP6_9BACT|nr:hypothetical protein [Candidatus Nitrospira allomarina]WNM56598.1 hypothetical protein PP769_11475 [Candidatus Nitrospira allomarina]
MNAPKFHLQWFPNVKIIMPLVVLLGITGFAFGSDLTGHVPESDRSATTQIQKDGQLDEGHRIIQGVVEEVNENTLRVDAGEAGELAPRYLNLANSEKKDDFKIGDTVLIEINAQNKVVNYQQLSKDGAKE